MTGKLTIEVVDDRSREDRSSSQRSNRYAMDAGIPEACSPPDYCGIVRLDGVNIGVTRGHALHLGGRHPTIRLLTAEEAGLPELKRLGTWGDVVLPDGRIVCTGADPVRFVGTEEEEDRRQERMYPPSAK